MAIIGYGRVSRVGKRKGASFLSPTQQREKCEWWAEQRGGLDEWVEDLDVSGGTLNRPGFQRILARLAPGDQLITAKLDRFARSNSDAYRAIETIQDAGATFVSVDDSFDLSTALGKLMFGILASFAQFERDRGIEDWWDVHARNVADGIPTREPWGYTRTEARTLTPTDEGREWVPKVFEWRAAHLPLAEIAGRLNSAGVLTRAGSRWGGDSVAVILANRAYLGEVAYGELVNPKAHEPLVTVGQWHGAQVARPARGTTKSESLLAGLVRCASCRYAMDYKPPAKTRNALYQCSAKHGAGVCPAPVSMVAGPLEDHVREWADAQLSATGEGLHDTPNGATPELTRAHEDARLAVELFLADPAREAKLGSERYGVQLDRLLAHEAESGAALNGLNEGGAVIAVESPWTLPVADQRLVLTHMIDCLFVRGRPGRGRTVPIAPRVHVCGRGEGPSADDLPRRGDGGVPYVLREFVFPDDPESTVGVAAVE